MLEAAALQVGDKVTLDAEGGGRSKRSVQQVERSHGSALAALAAVSSYLDSDEDLPTFFGRLSATIAEQIGARRAAFWRLGPRGTLSLQPAPHGFADDSPVYQVRLALGAKGEGVLDRLVFADNLALVKRTSPPLDTLWHGSGLTDAKNST